MKVDKGKLSERMGRKVMGLRQCIAMTARPPAFFVFVWKSIINGGFPQK